MHDSMVEGHIPRVAKNSVTGLPAEGGDSGKMSIFVGHCT